MDVAVAKIHLFSCLFMTGLIWLVQLVHYPSFKFYSVEQFAHAHAYHSRQISIIVMPVMLLELLTGIALIWLWPQFGLAVANLALIGVIWFSTFLLSVPLHNRLSLEADQEALDKLVLTNWPRTLAWTLRSVLLSVLFFNDLRSL